MEGDEIKINRKENEFELFSKAMVKSSCSECKCPSSCLGGCPAEKVVMGDSSCSAEENIIPVCRLWKSDF